MTCEELLRILNEYVDGAIDLPECRRFAEHLAHCNPCQVVVDTVRKTIVLYQHGREFPLPTELEQRLKLVLLDHWQRSYGNAPLSR
ncbi:MAG: hypothetical protein C4297_04495 [Gemmataceae bacterium]